MLNNRLCCCSYDGICSIIDIEEKEDKFIFNRVLDW